MVHICILVFYSTGGDDYTSGGYKVTFPAGSSTAQLTIDITDDDIAELTESFTARLSVSQSVSDLGVWTGARDNATVYIYDDDSIEVVFDPISYNVSEGDGEVTLTLRANSTASFDYTVRVDTSDGSAIGGIVILFIHSNKICSAYTCIAYYPHE